MCVCAHACVVRTFKIYFLGNFQVSTAAAAKSLQSCPTLCDPIDGSPPGSPVPGILQARTLEWVATSFSNAWKWKVKVKSLSHVWLLATPWTVAYQAPPPTGFSRQEYWSGVPLSSSKVSIKALLTIFTMLYLHPQNVFVTEVCTLWHLHLFPSFPQPMAITNLCSVSMSSGLYFCCCCFTFVFFFLPHVNEST